VKLTMVLMLGSCETDDEGKLLLTTTFSPFEFQSGQGHAKKKKQGTLRDKKQIEIAKLFML